MHTFICRNAKLSRNSQNIWHKPIALALTASLLVPSVAGCGGQAAPPPPADATLGQAPMAPRGNAQQSGGMSTRKKVVLLAGAAALYYMYKRKRDANNRATTTQYYLSKNGRVYYRDAQTKQAIYVTPPQGGIRVPADEASEFQQFQGYEGRSQGRTLEGLTN